MMDLEGEVTGYIFFHFFYQVWRVVRKIKHVKVQIHKSIHFTKALWVGYSCPRDAHQYLRLVLLYLFFLEIFSQERITSKGACEETYKKNCVSLKDSVNPVSLQERAYIKKNYILNPSDM